ncbi:Sec-independent protein translocase, TatC subunit [Pirellula staleyi DSM 6068]|uniref:Sec-independent protein translocase protein TatC n=1 Tax=Pirellula staleyi (strain ATCC 27377 / DSM 6068 / ICPB 4128) TaxID=530564 RepID=D2R7W3_PIRSD|nr:twin-arginine translocase subunit TatC [Pirellula staleyi]ADB19294.1 Sec-independent protein translocase, TatC subunit [Pirellula staleyi DSM 6068]
MAKKPLQEDLFEGTAMSFGEHLEELRVCLFRACVGVAIGCIIGFYIANGVVNFFQTPLENALENYDIEKAQLQLKESGEYGENIPAETLRLVVEDRMIPTTIHVETGKLMETLQLNYPGVFGSVSLSQYQLLPKDLVPNESKAASAIAAKILAGKSAADDKKSDPSAVAIWKLLSPLEQKLIERLGSAKPPLSKADAASLLELVNKLASQRATSDALKPLMEQLDAVEKTAAASLLKLVEVEKPAHDDVMHLNRLLLGHWLADHVRAPRVNLIPLQTWKPVGVRFQVLNAQEAFMIWMKAGFVSGLVLASPWVFLQIWNFVAAGLYPHEKNQVYVYLPISIALFLGGATLAFVFVFEPVLSFLFTFNRGMNAEFEPRIGEWLSFVLILPIGFGISFQLPLVMVLLNRLGLVSIELYTSQWRIAILVICIVSMVLTPADPISMLLMAGPLSLLYAVGIAMCKYMPRGRSPFQEVYEP